MKRSSAIQLVLIGSSLISLSACDQTPSAQSYTTKEECEKAHGTGKCDAKPREGGGSMFMPLMAGYMMGSMFNQPRSAPSAEAAPVQRGGFGGQARQYQSAGG